MAAVVCCNVSIGLACLAQRVVCMLPVSSIFLVSVQSWLDNGLPTVAVPAEIVIIIPLYIEHRLCRCLQFCCLLSVLWLVPVAYISADAVRDFRPSTRFALSLHHHRHLSLHHSVAALSAGLNPLIDDSEEYSVLFICFPLAGPALTSTLSTPVVHLCLPADRSPHFHFTRLYSIIDRRQHMLYIHRGP
jgi:hypothetical protein